MTELHRYRDTNTGLVVDLYDHQASVFPNTLERVRDDAKPKTLLPIEAEAAKAVRKKAEVPADTTNEKDK